MLILTLGVFVLGNLVAQADTSANKNKPEIKFDNTEIDLGIIPQGQPKTFEFEFTNTSSEPLIVSNVQPTCGCTIANWSKEPVLKGKKGFVKGTYNGSGSGLITKSITVFSNSKTPTLSLTFKATVAPPSSANTKTEQPVK